MIHLNRWDLDFCSKTQLISSVFKIFDFDVLKILGYSYGQFLEL